MLRSLIVVSLISPSKLIGGPVNTFHGPGRSITFGIDNTTFTDPDLVSAMTRNCDEGADILARLVEPGFPHMARFHITRDVPGNKMLHCEYDALQTDVFVYKGLLPDLVAAHLAAHTTHFIRNHVAKRRL